MHVLASAMLSVQLCEVGLGTRVGLLCHVGEGPNGAGVEAGKLVRRGWQ